MKYILVLQWSVNSEDDYDELIAMEDLLEENFPGAHGFVDGHDFGTTEMNIFICSDLPLIAFQDAMTSLRSSTRWTDVKSAYRRADEDRYVVVWPKTLKAFSVS
ncbi:hypothetical protein G205_17229 [Arthrobacter nitrophenolicus]|uniref:DUF3303 domain-containing protein n=1 Tax=Arthrobacter nitrophenolicus TaxID=683150 RepID=L8TPI1_9MICC|nr:hypothetical protein G205_17229 [Arthrobacter nitrophenolicus]